MVVNIKEVQIRRKMNIFLSLLVVGVMFCAVESIETQPKVQVYSRNPGKYGEENKLICQVSEFHPPDIEIKLLKNDVEIPGAKQTDLSFEQGWRFHLMKSVSFTPKDGETYSCKVRHLKNTKTYTWESIM